MEIDLHGFGTCRHSMMFELRIRDLTVYGGFDQLAFGIPFDEIVGSHTDNTAWISVDIHAIAPERHDIRLGTEFLIINDRPCDEELSILLYNAEVDFFTN